MTFGYKPKWKRRDYLGPAGREAAIRAEKNLRQSRVTAVSRKKNSKSSRATSTKLKSWLKPRSAKKIAEDKIYAKLRKEFLLEHPNCQRHGCYAKAQCVHHWAGRRSNYLVVATWRASCNPCNLFAKDHPKEARAENWIAPVGVYRV